MNFSDLYANLNFQEVRAGIAGERDTEAQLRQRARRALDRFEDELSPDDLTALLSPAANEFLEEMALKARYITRKRFGNTMQMYAPLYLSNECRSSCTYCGFSFENKVPRITLSPDEVVRDADFLHKEGIRYILLLTGEDYSNTPVSYLGDVADILRDKFPSISIEVYPLKEEEYSGLRERGLDGLAVYQETYDPVRYAQVHLRGVKKRMLYRLDCPDRGGRAGLRKIAVGALLGLSDPAADVYFTAMHARYLTQTYWRTQISISLPRLRPAEGLNDVPLVSDTDYVRYLTALRIFLPDAGINLSTRESAPFRNHLADICITHMSAGSRTEPGGYTAPGAQEQFSIEDTRSIVEVKEMLVSKGLDPLFVDWSPVYK